MEDNEKKFETEQPEVSEAEKLAEEILGGAPAVKAADLPAEPVSGADDPGEAPQDADEAEAKPRKKSLLWLWIVIAVVVLAGAAALILLLSKAPEPKEEPTKPTAAPTTTAPTTKPIVRVENPINFAELREQYDNEDIVAWVNVPNTNVDYPVAQSAEDESEDFYLHHNLDKEYEFAGTVYIQKLNQKDFTDPHTVLYGHAMLNGTMFKTLHYFQDKDFFDDNPEFYIYTPEHILTYKIFAAYQYDDRHLLYAFDTKNKDAFAAYLEEAQHPTASMQNTRRLPLKADDRIVTLSTCLKADAPIRYLVQGVLVKDELTY